MNSYNRALLQKKLWQFADRVCIAGIRLEKDKDASAFRQVLEDIDDVIAELEEIFEQDVDKKEVN